MNIKINSASPSYRHKSNKNTSLLGGDLTLIINKNDSLSSAFFLLTFKSFYNCSDEMPLPGVTIYFFFLTFRG